MHFETADRRTQVICLVSKDHGSAPTSRYWYGVYTAHRDKISSTGDSYLVLGCGSEGKTLLIPRSEMEAWLGRLGMTHRASGDSYWHVTIEEQAGRFSIRLKDGQAVDLTKYRM